MYAALIAENAQLRDQNFVLANQLGELNFLRTHNLLLKDTIGKMLQVTRVFNGVTSDCARCQHVLQLTDYFMRQGPPSTQASATSKAALGATVGIPVPPSMPPNRATTAPVFFEPQATESEVEILSNE
jgi:hypothetical protein